jgi:hypothetical protein
MKGADLLAVTCGQINTVAPHWVDKVNSGIWVVIPARQATCSGRAGTSTTTLCRSQL